jgi:hypothetical protein
MSFRLGCTLVSLPAAADFNDGTLDATTMAPFFEPTDPDATAPFLETFSGLLI